MITEGLEAARLTISELKARKEKVVFELSNIQKDKEETKKRLMNLL